MTKQVAAPSREHIDEDTAVDPFDLHVPYSRNDWLETTDDSSLKIARVRECYWRRDDDGQLRLYGDLWVYNYSGDRVGRESPVMGGPRTYEPYCDLTDYQRIQEPEFPIELHAWDRGDGTYTFRYQSRAPVLGPRKPRKKAKIAQAATKVVVVESNNGFDPEMEARALRLAAENLRDTAGSLPPESRSVVLEKAKQLEEQAAAFLAKPD